MSIVYSCSLNYDDYGRVLHATNIIDYLVSSTVYNNTVGTTYEYNPNGTLQDETTRFGSSGQIKSEYSYGEFNRLTGISRTAGSFDHDISYTYYSQSNKTTGLISTYTSTVNGTATTYNYTYDSKGNITQIVDSNGKTIKYYYDDLGQLTREINGVTGKTVIYSYDNAGNIKSKSVNESATYTYSSSQWGDLLTAYDGTAITYDNIGNPLSYYNGTSYTFTWAGRRLTNAVTSSKTMSFSYNDEGIRTSKTVNGVTTTYYVNGGQIVAEKNNSRTIVYIYDVTGAPIGMMYRRASYAEGVWDTFWYEKNLQGDIIGVCNSEGDTLISYNYSDAWGNYTVSYANGGGSTGAIHNPFKYRGYYYDADLGMYYLQSRYYDAKICRFISADGYVSTGQGILGNNMFAYCGNNPIVGYDPTGMWTLTISFGGDLTLLLFGVSKNICLSIDDEWNIAIMESYSLPNYMSNDETFHVGLIDANVSLAFQITNDDTIYDLTGVSTYIGGSGGGPSGYFGGDLVYSGFNPMNKETPHEITGLQFTVGPGVGVDTHVKTTYTKLLYSTNVTELFGWRWN